MFRHDRSDNGNKTQQRKVYAAAPINLQRMPTMGIPQSDTFQLTHTNRFVPS